MEKEGPEIDFNPFFHLLPTLLIEIIRQFLENEQSLPCLREKELGVSMDISRVS